MDEKNETGLDAGREQVRSNRLAEAANHKRALDTSGAFYFSDNGDDIEARIAQQPAAFDFAAHLHRQREWSETTFGPGARTAGLIDHIRKELLEIEAAPHDGEEWIDAVILALDGAWRCGLTPQQIVDGIVAKQAKNERRTWPDWRTADPTKAIEHDRASEQTAAVDEMADFEIHAGGEYFASVFGQREQAWKEAMHYVSKMRPEYGEPEVFEVTRRKVFLASQHQEPTT